MIERNSMVLYQECPAHEGDEPTFCVADGCIISNSEIKYLMDIWVDSLCLSAYEAVAYGKSHGRHALACRYPFGIKMMVFAAACLHTEKTVKARIPTVTQRAIREITLGNKDHARWVTTLRATLSSIADAERER